MAHPWYTALTAGLLTLAMAAEGDRTVKERLAVGLRTLAGCAAAVVGGGWLMRAIHG